MVKVVKVVKVDGHRLEEMEVHHNPLAAHLEKVMVVAEDSRQTKMKEVKLGGHQLEEMEVHRQPVAAHLEKVMVVVEDPHQMKAKDSQLGCHRMEEMEGKEDSYQTTMMERKVNGHRLEMMVEMETHR